MPTPSLFPYLMKAKGGAVNVVEAFSVELAASPDVEIANPVDVEVGQDVIDVEVEKPVDVEVPS